MSALLARALPAIVAVGVGLAGIALSRLSERRGVRWILAALATYGAVAFVSASVLGIPLRDALTGAGPFRPLPYFLQGAFIGAFIVLPIGWIVSVARAGIPRLREGSPQRPVYQAVALTVCSALIWMQLPFRSSIPDLSGPSAAERLVILGRSVRAIQDGDRDAPRDRWDPAYVVKTVGTSPEALFDWVRDHTRWVPYRGILRGPVGVLMGRDGNELDRSLLLGTLLRRAGHTVRLAHGELTREQAADLLSMLAPTDSPHDFVRETASTTPTQNRPPLPDGSAAIRAVAARYELGEAAIAQRITAEEHAVERLRSDLARRVADQTERLLAALPPPEHPDVENQRRSDATTALRDHWWVQVQRDGEWTDCDLIAGGRMGQSLIPARDTSSLDAVPSDLYHEISVRVVAEHRSRGTSREDRVLESLIRPADTAGQTFVLQFWPTNWPVETARTLDGRFGIKAAALEQKQWTAVLATAAGPLAHGIIDDLGEPSDRANAFTGLADAFSSQVTTAAHDTTLTALWIEYEVRVPGRPPRIVRRAVFDLLGADKRQQGAATAPSFSEDERLTRSLALMMQTDILPLGSQIAPEWVAHLANASSLSSYALLQSFLGADVPAERSELVNQLGQAIPAVSPLYLLAMFRSGWAADADSTIIDSPNLLTRHRYPAIEDHAVELKSAFDIVVNDVAVDLAVTGEFARLVRQGVVDTNLEALLSGDPTRPNTADAYDKSRDWATVTQEQRATVASLPLGPTSRGQILTDLDRGFVVVVPRSVAATRAANAVGWWRVDARSGATLGIGTNGWGMGPEDSALFNMAVSAARGFTFEYGLCQGFPAGINLLRYLNDSYFESWHPHWTTYNRSRSAHEVFNDNNAACLIGAIAMGVVATLPILLMTLSVRNMRMGVEFAEAVAAREAEAKALKAYEDDLLKLPGFDEPMPPQVKTQVWRDAGYTDTVVPRPQPGWRGDPAKILERENSIRAADEAMNRAQKELNTSMEEYMEYLRGRKPPQYGGRLLDPSYDPEVLEALRARAELDFGRYSDTVDQLAKLDPSRTGGWGGGGGGGAPPPQPIGNNNITGDAQQIAGAAGANSALGK